MGEKPPELDLEGHQITPETPPYLLTPEQKKVYYQEILDKADPEKVFDLEVEDLEEHWGDNTLLMLQFLPFGIGSIFTGWRSINKKIEDIQEVTALKIQAKLAEIKKKKQVAAATRGVAARAPTVETPVVTTAPVTTEVPTVVTSAPVTATPAPIVAAPSPVKTAQVIPLKISPAIPEVGAVTGGSSKKSLIKMGKSNTKKSNAIIRRIHNSRKIFHNTNKCYNGNACKNKTNKRTNKMKTKRIHK